jgi:RNA 2',3'-cyclic 3'-phosphodiesterase
VTGSGSAWSAVADGTQRLFVAVPVPPATRDACRAVIETVRATPAGGAPRWVDLDGLHLTLRFLGDTPDNLVGAVGDAVLAGAAGHAAFAVRLAGAGAFPEHGRKVRSLWLGIERGADELGAIVRDLGPGLAALGWAPDARPYRPHLTVARTDRTSIRDGHAVADALVAAASEWSTSFTADRAVLYRSHLGGGPPRYEPVVEVPLAQP